ncbi:M1 family metallopeptidase [Solwaraspora sp. WMMD1047]|uniref:M1 family metallopeptidase n=1 Tax=Solwaraspora sp. WMMD1047 TaxID=3016102 RepID=UPI002416C11C|nr:M1 family metallopeptidase [Solwaraspora sp. WMMD1047]MDG4828535.1 M1 family metallopeptidase [Solwaraspora sp. WMMD1047]
MTGCTGGPGTPRGGTSQTGTTPSFQPGAEGVGDPYFPGYGNGGYDVSSYHLRVRYDPATDRLTGDATITATATEDLSRFNLDLTGLTVTSVRVDGVDAEEEHDDAELIITPADGLVRGAEFTVDVGYEGVPSPVTSPDLGVGGFIATDDGGIALGQPESASTWFPVNDHPVDKATYDIEITVPEGLTALSNGVPGGNRTADGWTTWRWSERTPMASYLTTVVIGDYRVTTGTHAGKPLVTAIAASLPEGGGAEASIARTGEIADFLATRFGPYPFEAYGGVVVAEEEIRYALETQSRPVYGPTFFRSGPNDWVVAHELAHQWFGNSVSIQRWSDLWLNEGFASYAEWLWEEHDGGNTAQRNFETEYARTDWSSPTLDPGRAGLFGRAVYKRGALTVHALRLAMGDDVFFRFLRTWTAEKRDGNVTTADLITVAERVSGRPLRPLFDAWLSGTTPPAIPGG